MTHQPANSGSIASSQAVTDAASSSRSRGRFDPRGALKAILRIALVIALAFAVSRCVSEIGAPSSSPITRESETEAWVNPPDGTVNMLLPNGRPAQLEKGSMNHELQQFLASKEPPPQVFELDQLFFTYGSAEPMIDPADGIDDLAAILIAYPRARVKIVGYGGGEKPTAGVDLGAQRANAIVDALVAAGVAKSKMTAESGGDPGIVDDTSSPEDRFDDGNGQLIVMDK
jgi:outer membrane protein OmpA-like peptidoglycan-associated protein